MNRDVTDITSGRLVAVEGIDACGKSSLARLLADRLSAQGCSPLLLDRSCVSSALDGYPAGHLSALSALIWDYPPDAETSQLGFGHWSHLLAAWFHALDHLIVRPATAAGKWVIADSWYQKFIARFTLTVGPTAARLPFAGLTLPWAVIWLDVPPRMCAMRRPSQRATERGEWQGLAGQQRAFVAYQSRVRSVYTSLAREDGWVRIGPADLPSITDQASSALTLRLQHDSPDGEAER